MYNLTEVKKHIHVCIFTQCLDGLDYNVHAAFVYVCCLSCVGWLGGFSHPFNSSIDTIHTLVCVIIEPTSHNRREASCCNSRHRSCLPRFLKHVQIVNTQYNHYYYVILVHVNILFTCVYAHMYVDFRVHEVISLWVIIHGCICNLCVEI